MAAGCASSEADQSGGFTAVSQEESQEIAQEYLLNDSTFKFDGMEETLRLVDVDTLRCPYCWAFVFEFESRHSGYGDRTGLVILQVITPHTARIVVQEGEAVSAVMDVKWDMMEQKLIDANI